MFKLLVKNFEQAVIGYSWRGSKPTEEQEWFIDEYYKAKQELTDLIKKQQEEIKKLTIENQKLGHTIEELESEISKLSGN